MGDQHDSRTAQNTVLATYRLKPGAEPAFTEILLDHWATLHRLGMVEDTPAVIYRRVDDQGRVSFVEVFTWKPGATDKAHHHPEVGVTWEGMSGLVAPHDDLPPMEFVHYAPWHA